MKYINDNSTDSPRFAPFLNLGTLSRLPETSAGPKGPLTEKLKVIRDAGFVGVQGDCPKEAADAGLLHAASGRVNAVGEIDALVAAWKDSGSICATLHAGWGMEDDDTVDRLMADIVAAQERHDLPLYVETHRSTMTQDTWRTVEMLRRQPGIGINGDYSHWYTGLEMPYAGVDTVIDYIQPVFERVGFMHGRIGDSGCIQRDAGETLSQALELPHVQHYVQLWTATFSTFKRSAGAGEFLPFAPELLYPEINYALEMPDGQGGTVEETDRWTQALLYLDIARHCFEQA